MGFLFANHLQKINVVLTFLRFIVNWQQSQNIFLMPEKSKIGLHYTNR